MRIIDVIDVHIDMWKSIYDPDGSISKEALHRLHHVADLGTSIIHDMTIKNLQNDVKSLFAKRKAPSMLRPGLQLGQHEFCSMGV